MEISKFRVGLRTIKTGISVFICLLITIVLHRDTPVVATLTTVFALREDLDTTLKFGKHRVVGNTFGAVFSLLVIFIFELFGRGNIVQLITIPLVIMGMITVLVGFNCREGIVGACGTLLTIVFMIPLTASYGYALQRVVDSFIGTFVAIGVNYLIPARNNQRS